MSPTPRAWQRMLSGRRLDLLDPSPLDVEIGDIAHGLARVARWNGQTGGPHAFSVAQHCLLVEAIGAHLAPGSGHSVQLELLLHDAAEYVIGDIISPLKAAIGDSYKGVETRILTAVRRRFGLPEPDAILLRQVKRADRLAARIEAVRLAGFSEAEAARYFGRPLTLPDAILALAEPCPTDEAAVRYLARFHTLSRALSDPA